MTIDDLKEFDRYKEFKDFIKTFIVKNDTFLKIAYYPLSDPLNDVRAIDLEDPYDIFNPDTALNEDTNEGTHGVILFKSKNDKILNASVPVILIDFHSAKLGTTNTFDNVYIVFRIIMKGEAIQELANGLNRAFVLAKLIDDSFDRANVNDYGRVHLQSFEPIPLNEENSGYTLIYKARSLRGDLLDNKNYLQDKYGVDSREYL